LYNLLYNTTNYTNAEEEWDYVLGKGKKVWGVASDDAHSLDMVAKGWNVVYTNASDVKSLTKEDIVDSLFKGNYYASQGPNLNEIKLEGNKLTVTGDKSGTIEFITKGGAVVQKSDNVITASYDIKGTEGYVRAKFTREDSSWKSIGGGIGQKRSAWTNPFFIQSLYSVDIQAQDNIAIFDSKDTSVQLKADVNYNGSPSTEEVLWSLENAPQDGTVTIDSATGILNVKSTANEGKFTVIATLKNHSIAVASKVLTLQKTSGTYSLDIQGQDTISLSSGGQTVPFTANVKLNGSSVTEDVLWGLKDAPQDGTISIDNAGNLKISSTAKEETFTVTATLKKDETITASKVITLKKSDDNVVNVSGVALDNHNLSLSVGNEVTLKATVAPTDATNTNVKWTSSNPSVALVDQNGKVKAVAAGTADITATTEDGGYTAVCKVTVLDIYTIPTNYIIVNTTAIEMNYANAHPEVVVNEMNKSPDAKIYISTDLSSQIYNSSMIEGINKIIDAAHPEGKSVIMLKLTVNYQRIFGSIGYFTVNVNSNISEAKYFSLASDNNEKCNIRYGTKASAIGETIPIYLFDEGLNLMGKGTVQAYPENQCIVVEVLKDTK